MSRTCFLPRGLFFCLHFPGRRQSWSQWLFSMRKSNSPFRIFPDRPQSWRGLSGWFLIRRKSWSLAAGRKAFLWSFERVPMRRWMRLCFLLWKGEGNKSLSRFLPCCPFLGSRLRPNRRSFPWNQKCLGEGFRFESCGKPMPARFSALYLRTDSLCGRLKAWSGWKILFPSGWS